MIRPLILLQTNDARKLKNHTRRTHAHVVCRDHCHPVTIDSLNCFLPRPQTQRHITQRLKIRIQHQTRARLQRKSNTPSRPRYLRPNPGQAPPLKSLELARSLRRRRRAAAAPAGLLRRQRARRLALRLLPRGAAADRLRALRQRGGRGGRRGETGAGDGGRRREGRGGKGAAEKCGPHW